MDGRARGTRGSWRARTTAAALAGILLLAGCTSDPVTSGSSTVAPPSTGSTAGSGVSTGASGSRPSTGATSSRNGTAESSSSSLPTLPSGVTPATLPTAPSNIPDKRKGVAVTSCAQTDGGWGASGTAINTGDAEVEYSITVFFTTTAATTIDFATTTVKVAPGKTVQWSAAKKFKAADTMLCVLRAVS